MIDANLLRQLGWSDDLITEVNRVAEPMRRTSDKMDTGPNISAQNYSVGNAVYADVAIDATSEAIKIKSTR